MGYGHDGIGVAMKYQYIVDVCEAVGDIKSIALRIES